MRHSKQNGVALLLAMVMLLIISGMVIGLSYDVGLDVNISRNLRLRGEGFNWAESGLEISQELIAYAIDSAGEDNGTYTISAHGNYTVSNPSSLFLSNSTVTLSQDGQDLSTIRLDYMGQQTGVGNSIIIAAGYEGVGFGVGGGSSVSLFYHMDANGTSNNNLGSQDIRQVYRFVSGGK